ncbi:MAG TPA: hypothetical protein VK808_11405, partial [Bacteroidia bacterium]|nr:hypothetical protein [Bacteroidia bacterium]
MAKPGKKTPLSKTQKPVSKSPAKFEFIAPRYNPETDKKFLIITLGAFFLIGIIGVFHHEMWRDELQTWLVGASSNSFGEFLHNMKTECNPLLWYTSDFILSRFTKNPIIAQFYHLALSTGTVYLILRYGPFTRLQKVLLSFSYFIFFEYSLIARGYGMTIFLIFLFCAVYQQNKSKYRYPILALILLCVSNTTGHGVIMTLSLLGFMGTDYFFSEDSTIRKKYKHSQYFIAVAIVLVGIYIAFRCITPPPNSVYTNNWFTSFDSQRMAVSLRTFWMSFFPIPHISIVNFWNSNMFYSSNNSSPVFTLLFLVSLSIFIFCVLFYSEKISVAVFYLAATTGVLLFNYANTIIFRIYAANHYGFIFITFAVAAWLAADVKKTTFVIPGINALRNKLKIEKNFTYLVTGLFAVNMLAGVIAYAKDYSLTFSNIKNAGTYIIEHHLENLPEVGFID